jgi:hypothetical protein
VAGGVLRSRFRANWKIYLENINDTVHPVSTHESAAAAASAAWAAMPAQAPRPMAIQQLMPSARATSSSKRWARGSCRTGTASSGTNFSIHSGYGDLPGYEAPSRRRHGADRTAQILAFSPQNAVFYPSLAVKASPQILRVLRPIAVDCTEVEAWALEPVGAPAELLQRALTYNRLVSRRCRWWRTTTCTSSRASRPRSPSSHPWVSLHRGHREGEASTPVRDVAAPTRP